MSKLWLVKIHEDDFDYDCFVSAVVWAETPEEAEAMIRAEPRSYEDTAAPLPLGDKTRLIVSPAPPAGIIHEHWHPG